MSKSFSIFFDIDRTIFDTQQFVELIEKKLSKLIGVNLEKYQQAGEAYLTTLQSSVEFHPLAYADHISQYFNFPREKIIFELLENETTFQQAIFPETTQVLAELGQKYQLGAFSEGVIDFQLAKITKSGLIKYFNPAQIFLFDSKQAPAAIAQLPEDCVVIDDKLQVVKKLLQHQRRAIWINRHSSKKHAQFETIFRLDELEKFL